MRRPIFACLALSSLVGVAMGNAWATDDYIIVQSTTSTQNSGLYDAILPEYTKASGKIVRIVAVGTGQAIRNARNCDGDVLLVHAREAEEKFVAEGYGLDRRDLMYNDFILVGPAADPASIAKANGIADALAALANARATFVSRGDDSGTHKKERALWNGAGVDPDGYSGTWYRETGSGMGATLNIAIGMGAYTLTDRATWIAFGNKGDHRILSEGDEALFNQYGVIAVNPEKCPDVRSGSAQDFIDWLLSNAGQSTIAAYSLNGQQLFFPNAVK